MERPIKRSKNKSLTNKHLTSKVFKINYLFFKPDYIRYTIIYYFRLIKPLILFF